MNNPYKSFYYLLSKKFEFSLVDQSERHVFGSRFFTYVVGKQCRTENVSRRITNTISLYKLT